MDAGRLARAGALGILCTEEVAKVVMVEGALTVLDVTWQQLQRSLRKHELKLAVNVSMVRRMFAADDPRLQELNEIMARAGGDEKMAGRINMVKQALFYAGEWAGRLIAPAQFATPENVRGLIASAIGAPGLLTSIRWACQGDDHSSDGYQNQKP